MIAWLYQVKCSKIDFRRVVGDQLIIRKIVFFSLQVLGEKVVALERLWVFASDTLQPLLFILFFILQVYSGAK